MFKLYGRRREEFPGAYEAWLAGVHPEDRERCDKESQLAREGGSDYDSEFRVVWPDGSIRHIKALGEVFRDERGTPARMLGVNFDITERNVAKLALIESQTKLEVALASMTDAVFISDTSGKFIHFNDAFVTFHRFATREECALHHENYLDIIDVFMDNGTPAPLEMWAVPRALRGETVANAEYTIRRKDSGETWYGSYSFGPIRDRAGSIIGSVVVGRDITEKKQADAEAFEREERFRQIAENIREVFWLNDPVNGRLLYVSRAYETIWGRSCEESYSKPGEWLDAVHPEDQVRVREAFVIQQQGGTYSVDYRILRPDGTLRWIHDRGFPIRNDAGEVYRIAGVAEDITERRQAEVESQQQRMRLEGIVDSAMDGIITINEEQRVLLINAAAERMFGWLASEVLGKHVERFIPERFRAGHAENVTDFGRTGIAARAMGRFGPISGLRANGEEFPLEASISQIEVDGHVLYTVTCRDVTERVRAAEIQKKLETQLHQSQKMEAFGQLAGGVAHDFNNLLTVISGYSEWMLTTLAIEGDLRNMVSEILRAAERATALTRQLLAFSRQQVIEPKILDLNSVVDDVGKMLRRLIGEDIQLATVLTPSIGLVKIDPGQIEQVLMNLAVNARDAMPRGGRLTIETGATELERSHAEGRAGADKNEFAMLAISDTGAGMSQETLERIFEPFFTTKGVGKGTGLGLAVVHGIVEQSGGIIEVYSELGHGTTFKIYLPIVRDGVAKVEASAQSAAPRGTETILLVEDEIGVRQVTFLALQSLGYTVLEASGGEAALKIMADHEGNVDLLLSDVVMPEMSGRTLAETLAVDFPALRVLFVSGYTDDAIVRHGVLQAEVAFLQKPFTMRSLARKVREVLDES